MDGHITPAGKSVLDEPRLDPTFVVKAKLAIRIQKSITKMGLKQREAAARMGITQPKHSLISRGKLEDISQTSWRPAFGLWGTTSRLRLDRGIMGWARSRFGMLSE